MLFRSLRQLTNLTQPVQISDVLFLPIDAFGAGQPHSHSCDLEEDEDGKLRPCVKNVCLVRALSVSWIDASQQHHFRGSWRDGGDAPPSANDEQQEEE